MCFQGTDKQLYVAEEDIVCYKEVTKLTAKTCLSYWTEFKYKFGKLYNLLNSCAVTTGGYDNTPDPEDITLQNKLFLDDRLINKDLANYFEVHKGFHSFKFKKETDCIRPNVRCIIPKGSEYYQNETEYVSNQIIIVEKL
jgi:hypothetical protein